jgi:hypothetical protein
MILIVANRHISAQDVVPLTTSKKERFIKDIRICDSGACRHCCKYPLGLFNVEEIKESIMVGNGNSIMENKIRSLKYWVVKIDGSRLDITHHEVKIVSELWVNMFSINKALKIGYHL